MLIYAVFMLYKQSNYLAIIYLYILNEKIAML